MELLRGERGAVPPGWAPAGLDWRATNRSTLSVSQSVRGRSYANSDRLDYIETDGTGSLLDSGVQFNDGSNEGNELTSQVLFKHRTPKEGREWTTDLTYNRSRRNSDATYTTENFDADGVPAAAPWPTEPTLSGLLAMPGVLTETGAGQ